METSTKGAESVTLKKTPHPSERSLHTDDLSEASDNENPGNLFTEVVATLVTTKEERNVLSKEERTQKTRTKVRRFAKLLKQIVLELAQVFRLFLFLASIGVMLLTFVQFGFISNQIVNYYSDVPTCVYQWAEWGECSAPCKTPNGPFPNRTRRVIPESIVDMRNLTKEDSYGHIWYQTFKSLVKSKCFQIQQTSRCNIYECPVKLSTLTEFTSCTHANLSTNSSNEKCFEYLKLPPRGFVHVDAILPITKDCNCSDIDLLS